MELLTVTLAANETKQFAKAGRYFEIIDSSYAVQVDFTGDQGQRSDSMINALSGLFVEDPYSGFAITNGAIAQNVTLLVMENGRGGSRRQPGIVQVIDGGKERTKANLAFTLATQLVGVAAQYSYIALVNPAVSGRRAVIDQMLVTGICATQDFIVGFITPGAIGALLGNPPSKLSNGAVSIMETRTLQQVGSLSGNSLFICPASTSSPVVWRPPEPIIVLPGYCYFLRAAINAALICTMDYYEEPI